MSNNTPHKWVTGESNQTTNKQQKFTVWTCSRCQASFNHNYGLHLNWDTDRIAADIGEICTGKQSTNLGAEIEEIVMLPEVDVKQVICKSCLGKVKDVSIANKCAECKELICRGWCSKDYETDVYCSPCLKLVKRKRAICEKCSKPDAQRECIKCDRLYCLNCGVDCDTGFRCSRCSDGDEMVLAFLVGKANFNNYDEAVMAFYSRPKKYQKI